MTNKAFVPTDYTDNPELNFKDVRNENYRTYIFPPPVEGWDNSRMRVDDPEAVSFKAPPSWVAGGSHRVVTKNGLSVYIPPGWIGIEWEKNAGKRAYEW